MEGLFALRFLHSLARGIGKPLPSRSPFLGSLLGLRQVVTVKFAIS